MIGDTRRARSRYRRVGFLLALPAALGIVDYAYGLPLEPDASYYTGGIALFPSPLGTVLGTAGGYPGLTLLNAASAFAIILLVALLALELGSPPLVAQVLVLLVVPVTWFWSWGMDAPAVALLLAAAVLQLRGHSSWAVALACLGCATHLAVLPLALGVVILHSRGRSLVVAVGLVAAGAGVALFTAYRAAFGVLLQPSAFVEGAHELLLASWPVLLLVPIATLQPRVRPFVFGAALGAIVAGAIPASVGQVGLTRYAIPCVFIALAGIRFRPVLQGRLARLPFRSSTFELIEESGDSTVPAYRLQPD